MKKTVLYTAMLAVVGVSALASVGTQAATLNTGDTLTIQSGVYALDAYGNPSNVASGSWFGMDNGDSKIAGTEKTAITGLNGIVIGTLQSNVNNIDSWSYFGAGGSHTTQGTAVTGSTEAGLNMSGWVVNWNNTLIPMTTGAWNPTNATALGAPTSFTNGVASFTWDGVYGHSYSLWYTATVPQSAPCCQGVQYSLHLVGTVAAAAPVPVPAAVWLLGSGLVGLVGVARRRKNVV